MVPPVLSWSTMVLTVEAGMANAIPTLPPFGE